MVLDERVRSTDPPWITLCALGPERHPESLVSPPAGFAVRLIDGRRCATKRDLFCEFARAMEFPSYFGQNWDAFEELLADLSWLPAAGYIILVTDAEHVLVRDDRDYATFLDVLETAGREWAAPPAGVRPRPPVPFHVIFTVAAENVAKRTDWRLVPHAC